MFENYVNFHNIIVCSPTLSHSGGSILHLCLCFRLTASHSGTSQCMDGLKGPNSPCTSQSLTRYRQA